MSEDYLLINAKKSSGSFSKLVAVVSLLALVAAVVIGIVISTQVAKLPKAAKGSGEIYQDPTNPDWGVRTRYKVLADLSI